MPTPASRQRVTALSASNSRGIRLVPLHLALLYALHALLPSPVHCNPSQKHFGYNAAAKLRAGRVAATIKAVSSAIKEDIFESAPDPSLHEPFESEYDAEYTLLGGGCLIDDFLRDASLVQVGLNTALTTPCHRFSKFTVDSSYSKIWTNADWDKHCEAPLKRYTRHAISWPVSTTATAVMPITFAMGLYAFAVCMLSVYVPSVLTFLKSISINDGGLMGAFSASPIALLLTLRTNRALDRLVDAKKNWGLMKRSVRSLTGLICTYAAPTDTETVLLACRYLVLLPWSLKGFLREEDDEVVIRTVLPSEEAEWVLSAPAEQPLAILSRLRKLIKLLAQDETSHLQMCERLYDLETVVGTSKRLLASPVAPTFTRHTSRLVALYLCLLPPALLGSGVAPITVVLTTLLTTYILVGIDEIGLKIERPFPFLPMHALCTMSQTNVMNQVLMMRDMPGGVSA